MKNFGYADWQQRLDRLLVQRDPRRDKVYLTRAAWLIIGVVIFIGAVLVLAGINQIATGWGMQPIPHGIRTRIDKPAPVIAVSPELTATLSPCAVTWQFIPGTPFPGVGYVGTVDNPQVVEKVKADYVTAWNWMYSSNHFWDEGQASWYYRGTALSNVLETIADQRTKKEYYQRVLGSQNLTDLYFVSQTRVFFADIEKKPVTLAFDAETGLEKRRAPGGDMVLWQVTMTYDATACRWLVVDMTQQPFATK